jgi:hypothetical protein
MGGAGSVEKEHKNAFKILVRKFERKHLSTRPRSRCGGSITIKLREIVLEMFRALISNKNFTENVYGTTGPYFHSFHYLSYIYLIEFAIFYSERKWDDIKELKRYRGVLNIIKYTLKYNLVKNFWFSLAS